MRTGNSVRGGVENGPYQLLISDKILFHELMNYYGLPVPKMLFVYKNHQFFVDSELSSDESIDKILNECFDSRIFVKFPSVGAAKGVFLMERCSDGYFPPYRSVGFDIVTTPIGPVVLEINTGAGMDLAQVGKEYGIAKVFYPEKF